MLTPTRELAAQIDECCRDYARYTDIRHCVIFGGVNQRPQVDALQRGIDLLVATPGRLLDLIGQGYVSLADIRFFVLDEADRMLDMGFIHDIRRILPLLPRERQTLFFSATMPDDIVKLANTMLRNPAHVTVTPPASVVETIRQSVLFAEKAEKRTLLASLLRERPESSVLVFSRTKHGADRIARILTKAGIEGRAIHGDKSQGARERAMNDFRSGACRVLIATDIAARGIDIGELHAGNQLRPAGSARDLCPPHRPHGTRRARRTGHRLLLGGGTPAAERHPQTDRTGTRPGFRGTGSRTKQPEKASREKTGYSTNRRAEASGGKASRTKTARTKSGRTEAGQAQAAGTGSRRSETARATNRRQADPGRATAAGQGRRGTPGTPPQP